MSELRLIKTYVAQTDSAWWTRRPLPTLYHAVISLILSQRIRFAVSKRIRARLTANHGGEEYDPKTMQTLRLSDFGIGEKLAATIAEITQLALTDEFNYEQLKKVKGVGEWTLKGIRVMLFLDEETFLAEDTWIRDRLTQLCETPKRMTRAQCDTLIEDWTDKTRIFLFLWRIKSDGIAKMKKGQPLERSDFL